MDKLIELSKPVAWKLHYYGRGHYFEENAHVVALTESMRKAKGEALYSHGYVSALLARIEELEATEIKPEGMKLMSEAIGAHGYIVGCLVQGRHDLALEESRKWVDAFSQAAELINNG